MSSGSGEVQLDSEYILNVEPAEFPDGLGLGCERQGSEWIDFSASVTGRIKVSSPEMRKALGGASLGRKA